MNSNWKWKVFFIVSVMALSLWKVIPIDKALNLGLDLQGGTYLTLEVDDSELPEDQKEDIVDVALEIIRNRIDEFGVAEPVIQKGSGNRIIVQIPGVGTEGAKRIKDIILRQAHLEFRLVVDDPEKLKMAEEGRLTSSMKRDYELLMEETKNPNGRVEENPLLLETKALVTGDMLVDARVNFDSGGFGQTTVGLEFNRKGARRFEKLTGENVNRRLAIVLDNKVQSAPVINERIGGGRASISGSFSIDEAKDLAISLRAGALPAPVNIIQESTVGPSLGADSIRMGVRAMVFGFVAVVFFMAIYYLLSGLLADFALCLNLLFVMAALSYFNATLTLPGIAGLILTIGMAVDANVLIFERIREEIASGKSARAAMAAGYGKAFWTICDSNITTLITAIVLFKFGTGPIRGFAVTLTVGILASMFTALFVTRVIFDGVITKWGVKKLSI